MHTSKFNAAIIGGGPTGCVLAVLLARLTSDPQSIILFQSEQQPRYGLKASEDPRVIAVNEGTRVLLQDLDAWSDDAAAIHTIHVSQAHRLGRTLIRDTDFNVPALGYVVRYASLQQRLLAVAQRAGITLRTGTNAQLWQDEQGVWVTHDETRYDCRLGIRADGMLAPSEREHYEQVALLGQIQVRDPRPGWAFERFTREGPFAVLPHPAANGAQSLVWCCSPEYADQILQLDQTAQEAAMHEAFGERLGPITLTSQNLTRFPLYKSFEHAPVQERIVSIGNASQTLHPVAGQGLNLALRDAATLAHCLRDWIAASEQPVERALAIYCNLRARDRQLTSGLTDFLSTAFTTQSPLFEHGAGLTLLGLDLLPPLRTILARHLMQGFRA